MSNIIDSLKNIISSELLKDAQNILKTSDNKYIGMIYQIIKTKNVNSEDLSINNDRNSEKELSNINEELNCDNSQKEDYDILFSKLEDISLNINILEKVLSNK